MPKGRTLATVLTRLRGAGYAVWHSLIDAATILPQTRVRIYIVGFRVDIAPKDFAFPVLPKLAREGIEVLESLSDAEVAELTLSDHQWENVKGSNYYTKHPESRVLGAGGPAQTLQSSYRSGYRLYSQFVPPKQTNKQTNKPTATAAATAATTATATTTAGASTAGAGAGAVDTGSGSGDASASKAQCGNPRFLSPRECTRLMGFPETFRIPAMPLACGYYKQIGNAACPPVLAAIGKNMVAVLQQQQQLKGQSEGGPFAVPLEGGEGEAGLSPALRLTLRAAGPDARSALVERHSAIFNPKAIQKQKNL